MKLEVVKKDLISILKEKIKKLLYNICKEK